MNTEPLYRVMCPAKLFQCCGLGTLRCEREHGHEGPHVEGLTEW